MRLWYRNQDYYGDIINLDMTVDIQKQETPRNTLNLTMILSYHTPYINTQGGGSDFPP
jgi:hypothetical protein